MRLTSILIAVPLVLGAASPVSADDSGEPPTFAVTETAGAHDSLSRARELVLHAMGFLGVRYRYGGSSPATGFDCSGLVQYVFGEVTGLALPRTSHDISRFGNRVTRDELQPGDLVFFNTLRRPFSHVGIYLGEQRFIHAPRSGGHVEIVDMANRYWQQRYNGARRISF
ncbi:MAG: C40 family peptidase [Burkholderiales bacterium]|nr:C40 family peptidase [Burkholderiales bacterium]